MSLNATLTTALVAGLMGVAEEAMALSDVTFARLLVDPAVPRQEIVRLSAGATPAKLTRVLGQLRPAELVIAMTKAAMMVSGGPMIAGAISGKVLSLTEGVVKMMLIAKLKNVSLLLISAALVSLATGGVGVRHSHPSSRTCGE